MRPLRWAVLLGATALVVYLCARMLAPFVGVIAWASVLAISFYPVHQRFLQRTRRQTLSAFLTTMLVLVTILIPLAVVTGLVVNEILVLQAYAQDTFQGDILQSLAPILKLAEWLLVRVGLNPERVLGTIGQHASEIAQVGAGYALLAVTNVGGAIVSFIFILFTVFFLFRDGAWMAARIPDFLPFDRVRSEAVLHRIREVIYASVYGVIVIAVIQGILMGLAFWVLGIPSASLWGVVTVVTSVIPLLGAGAVWAPGALYLALTGQWLKALLLLAWGGLVVSSVDNFLRPKLVGGRVGLSELVIFFSVLGGIQVFGLLGLVAGPVIFAIAGSLIEVLSEERAVSAGSSPRR